MKLKAVLLSIVAVLTLGLTSCSDETSGDQTQGKPGYLTINVKTLKPNQSKVSGTGATTDYTEIHNLNIYVFSGANAIIHRYYDDVTANGIPDITVTAGVVTGIDIPVSSLTPGTDYVVVVANYGSRIDDATVNTYDNLQNLDISTVGDYTTSGLHMTGKAEIIDGVATSYLSNVKVAPIESKITVDWTFATGSEAAYYDVTGVYVVNAVSSTKLPIIRQNNYTLATTSWATINIPPAGYINLTGSTPSRNALSGLALSNHDYNFYYTTDQSNANLKNEVLTSDIDVTTPTQPYLKAGYTKLIDLTELPTPTKTKLHYYVGENYSNNIPATAGSGAMVANLAANSTHQNTLVVVRVTPLSTAPAYIKAMGHRYYTYELNRESTGATGKNCTELGSGTIASDGFSVRRKTNYNLTFNLSSIGSEYPFTKLKYLRVNVEADGWDPESPAVTF